MAEGGARVELDEGQRRLVASVREPLRKLAKVMRRDQSAGEEEDLFQIAMEAACRLAPTFDPRRGSAFLSYVFPRVRGAMLDHCIAEAKVRAQARALQRGARLVHELVDRGDIATMIAEGPDQRRARLDDARFALAGAAVLGLLGAPASPEDLLMLEQDRAALRQKLEPALAALDPIDRAIVVRCTVEEISLAEAARAVGLPYDKARYRYLATMAWLGRRIRGG